MPNFEQMKAGYRNLWTAMRVKQGRQAAVDAVANRINNGRDLYQKVALSFPGLPWWVIGAWHYRESNLDFRTHLHNGDPLSRRTTHVPAGRPSSGTPPFTWEESAIDALRIKKLQNIRDWTMERVLFESERYNGFGYLNKNVNSPYVWAGSNLYSMGKYVADGKFDPNHVDKQLGVAPIFRRLFELGYAAELKRAAVELPPDPIGEIRDPSPPAEPPKAPTESKTLWAKVMEFAGAGGATILGGLAGLDWKVVAVIVVGILLVGTFFIIRERMKRDDIDKDTPIAKTLGV